MSESQLGQSVRRPLVFLSIFDWWYHAHGHIDRPADEFDAWLDAFATAEADDTLDRQLFAIREALADFRSL